MVKEEILYKKPKLTDENGEKNDMRTKGTIVMNRAPKIFKLNIDCFDEIFEYLSLKDLHSLGQTCMAMQQVTGEYYKRNYSAAEKLIGNDGIYTIYSDDNGAINRRTQTSAFNQFHQFLSHHYENFEPFRYIQVHSNEFISVNHLCLVCVGLSSLKMSFFQSILPQIEIAQIRQCTIWNGDFYDIFLQFCKKLKRLYIQNDLGDIVKRSQNPWLLRNYPMLEHLELTPRYSYEIAELGEFFKINCNICSFSISSHCLWINRQQFFESEIKLDLLEVKHFHSGFYFYQVERISIESICVVLKQLYEQGFYKKMHFYVKDMYEGDCIQLRTIQGLEKLTIKEVHVTGDCLTHLINLKELSIFDCTVANLDDVANHLTKIERVFLQNATYDHMMTFIRHSARLNALKIVINDTEHFNGGILDLVKLNNERKKLHNARKLIIYIEDNIFLPTKWANANGDTNLSFVEVKRSKSLCWDYDCSTIKTMH